MSVPPLIAQVLGSTAGYALVYATASVGLTLSYRTLRFLVLSYPVYMTFGAYTAIILREVLLINNPLVLGLSSFSVSSALMSLSQLLLFKPLADLGAGSVELMVASLGIWILLKYLMYIVLDLVGGTLSVSLVSYPRLDYDINLVGAVAALLAFASLYIVLEKTKLGIYMRAYSGNPVLASISGLNPTLIELYTCIISGGFAGLSGFLWTMIGTTSPELGDRLILSVFASSVIGGLQSLLLSAAAALLVSSVENIGVLTASTLFGVPASLRGFITFSVLLAFLIAKPPRGAAEALPYRFRTRGVRR